MEPRYALLGFLAGGLVGLTGMGGAAIVTPLLMYFGIPPAVAIGTDLVYNAVTKLVGTLTHVRGRTINLGVIARLAAGSVPGSLIGTGVLGLLRAHHTAILDQFMSQAVGVVLVLVGLITVYYLFRPPTGQGQGNQSSPPPTVALIIAGAAVGFTVSISSIGSGTLLMAVLLPLWPASGITLVGTDIVHGAILTTTASLGHLVVGDVDFHLVANLLVGSIPGIVASTFLARRLPTVAIKGALACVLIVLGAGLL